MTDLRNRIVNRVRIIRKIKGLTQQQLAEVFSLNDASIGATQSGEIDEFAIAISELSFK